MHCGCAASIARRVLGAFAAVPADPPLLVMPAQPDTHALPLPQVRRHLNGVLRMVWILRSLPDDVQQHNMGSAPGGNSAE